MIQQTILMTGATGLVGSRFLELFSDKYQVVNMDLTTGVDITRVETFKPFFDQNQDAKFLIHLAAFTDTAKAQSEVGDKAGITYKVNVTGTANIANVCKEYGIHLIHISTDFVFDGNSSEPYTEETPVSPLDWYGETKAMAETVVQKSSVDYTILRLSYPYRANYDLKPDLIQKIRSKLAEGTLPPQFADSVITPTFIDDLARSFDRVIDLRPSGIFHTAGSTALSPYDLARSVALAYGFDPSLVKQGSLTKYLETAEHPFARKVAMSNHKATEILGLHYATVEEGLAEVKKQQGL